MGFGVAIWLGMRAGDGEVKFLSGLMLVAAMFAVMVMLGDRAWMLLPLGMSLDVPVPISFGRDFTCRELTCMVMIAYTAVRVSLRREKIVVFRKEHLWPILYCAWAFMVFGLNPIGLQVFGADVAGARYYFQIFLGLCAFLIVANRSVGESNSKWIVGYLVFASLVNMTYSIWAFQTGRSYGYQPDNPFAASEEFYTWHQAIGVPASMFLMLCLARYPLERFMSVRGLPLWGIGAAALTLTFLSGKRAGVGLLLLMPVFATVLRRRYGVGLFMTMVVAGVFAVATVAHGRWVTLPLTAQRALSWLPGKWDARVQDLGASDEFRSQMRKLALAEIEKHPWIGPGFAINIREYTADFGGRVGAKLTDATHGHSWHTLWLGIAADFGIPAAFIWFFLLWSFTRRGLRAVKALPELSWRNTLAGYIVLTLFSTWATSYTGGHSALGALNSWWFWGLLLPLSREAEAEAAPAPAPTEA